MNDWIDRFRGVRAFTEKLTEPLSPEDCSVQSMEDASPTRWHLAHTTWFFETFLLKQVEGYEAENPQYESLFNSYYNAVDKPYPRARRGVLSRPNHEEVVRYRHLVDNAVIDFLDRGPLDTNQQQILETGLQHEQQHQELILTDIKHALSCNPLKPVYHNDIANASRETAVNRIDETTPKNQEWVEGSEGVVEFGCQSSGFAFDNERPVHRGLLQPFEISSSVVTNGDYLEFMERGGYQRPDWWLSLGWATCQEEGWTSPLYWEQENGQWYQFTLDGYRPVRESEPVCHVSYFEADAYARWAGARLPTEFEWENAVESALDVSTDAEFEGHWSSSLLESNVPLHPRVAKGDSQVRSLVNALGNQWEWTSSPYTAYPGYAPPEGALGEYNGKFMCNQFVLRGGSCATPAGHLRTTYRNFFSPDTRWQFSGIRLAR